MKIFSAYYDRVPSLEESAYTFVRVSHDEPPAWFMEAYEYVDLSDTFGPTSAMLDECHPTKDWAAFAPRYSKEILGVLDWEATRELLKKIYEKHGNRPLLLLCFEAPPEHCHRYLIGDFLNIDVQEI